MSTSNERTLIVSGASGQLGRQVVEHLLSAGERRVVALSRSPERLADLAARGVVVRRADFERPEELVDAFAGGDRLLLISTDAVDQPGRRRAQHLAAVDAAARAGVGHVVYTSLTGPDDSPVTIAPDHRDTEAALAATGLGFTILRNNLYTEFLLGGLGRAVATGELVAAAGDGGVGYVTRADCARAAAAALRAATTGRVTLDITGPELVTHAELARLAGELAGRPIAYVPVTADALQAGMLAAGVPAGFAEILASFDVAVARGKLAVVSNAVAELTGRPPTSVAAFLAAHRDALLGARA